MAPLSPNQKGGESLLSSPLKLVDRKSSTDSRSTKSSSSTEWTPNRFPILFALSQSEAGRAYPPSDEDGYVHYTAVDCREVLTTWRQEVGDSDPHAQVLESIIHGSYETNARTLDWLRLWMWRLGVHKWTSHAPSRVRGKPGWAALFSPILRGEWVYKSDSPAVIRTKACSWLGNALALGRPDVAFKILAALKRSMAGDLKELLDLEKEIYDAGWRI